ncbi:hypothetical protein [Bacteroides sp. An322]|uniref:hypothetical protein n=1 Tax=Bacteroides sp. An322 TaxID=1965632 RepID=UPI000B3874C3|nr:hypothetical protein [Bacteroides sp. An322]OUO23744.1 hypothetical protein B5F91_02565 [Bacteroides sp. An322]
MIKESYVSFETAKMLKEAGFDVPCTSQYTDNGFGWDNLSRVNYNSCKSLFSRPTQALAARWLREVYKLHVFAKRTYEYALDKFSWGYYIQSSNYEYCKNFEIGFDSYEQAIEDGLREAIKLIKK